MKLTYADNSIHLQVAWTLENTCNHSCQVCWCRYLRSHCSFHTHWHLLKLIVHRTWLYNEYGHDPPTHACTSNCLSPIHPAQQFGIMWCTAKAFFWRGDHVTSRWVTGTRRFGAWKIKPTLLYPKLFYIPVLFVEGLPFVLQSSVCHLYLYLASSYTGRMHNVVCGKPEQVQVHAHSFINISFIRSFMTFRKWISGHRIWWVTTQELWVRLIEAV